MGINKVVAQLIGLQGLSVRGIDFDGDALVIACLVSRPSGRRVPLRFATF